MPKYTVKTKPPGLPLVFYTDRRDDAEAFAEATGRECEIEETPSTPEKSESIPLDYFKRIV